MQHMQPNMSSSKALWGYAKMHTFYMIFASKYNRHGMHTNACKKDAMCSMYYNT